MVQELVKIAKVGVKVPLNLGADGRDVLGASRSTDLSDEARVTAHGQSASLGRCFEMLGRRRKKAVLVQEKNDFCWNLDNFRLLIYHSRSTSQQEQQARTIGHLRRSGSWFRLPQLPRTSG